MGAVTNRLHSYDTLAEAMSYDPPSYVVNYTETRYLVTPEKPQEFSMDAG